MEFKNYMVIYYSTLIKEREYEKKLSTNLLRCSDGNSYVLHVF